jgi:nucleoside-diphosphate-sugar epimerase
VVRTILRELKKPESLIAFVKDRPGHDLRYAIDPAKISGTGLDACHRFDEGIRKTVRWYLDHRAWWEEDILKGDYRNYYERMYAHRGAKRMKVLVTARNGQLGYDLMRRLEARGIAHRGIDIADCDLTDAAATRAYLLAYAPDRVISLRRLYPGGPGRERAGIVPPD